MREHPIRGRPEAPLRKPVGVSELALLLLTLSATGDDGSPGVTSRDTRSTMAGPVSHTSQWP